MSTTIIGCFKPKKHNHDQKSKIHDMSLPFDSPLPSLMKSPQMYQQNQESVQISRSSSRKSLGSFKRLSLGNETLKRTTSRLFSSPKFNFEPFQKIGSPFSSSKTKENNNPSLANTPTSSKPDDNLVSEKKDHAKTKKKLHQMEERYLELKNEAYKWESYSKNLQRDLVYLRNEFDVMNSQSQTSNNPISLPPPRLDNQTIVQNNAQSSAPMTFRDSDGGLIQVISNNIANSANSKTSPEARWQRLEAEAHFKKCSKKNSSSIQHQKNRFLEKKTSKISKSIKKSLSMRAPNNFKNSQNEKNNSQKRTESHIDLAHIPLPEPVINLNPITEVQIDKLSKKINQVNMNQVYSGGLPGSALAACNNIFNISHIHNLSQNHIQNLNQNSQIPNESSTFYDALEPKLQIRDRVNEVVNNNNFLQMSPNLLENIPATKLFSSNYQINYQKKLIRQNNNNSTSTPIRSDRKRQVRRSISKRNEKFFGISMKDLSYQIRNSPNHLSSSDNHNFLHHNIYRNFNPKVSDTRNPGNVIGKSKSFAFRGSDDPLIRRNIRIRNSRFFNSGFTSCSSGYNTDSGQQQRRVSSRSRRQHLVQ